MADLGAALRCAGDEVGNGGITDFFSNRSNILIERQDRRVVVTQRPYRSDLRIGEKFIPGDGPVIEYRRQRQALIEGK